MWDLGSPCLLPLRPGAARVVACLHVSSENAAISGQLRGRRSRPLWLESGPRADGDGGEAPGRKGEGGLGGHALPRMGTLHFPAAAPGRGHPEQRSQRNNAPEECVSSV